MVQSINATTPLEEARAVLSANYDLKFTKAVAKVTARVHERVRKRVSDEDWAALAPLIVQINRLKREKKAAILAHIQQAPEIYFGVADRVGDSLKLLQGAAKTREAIVVFAGLMPVAESFKLLAPSRRVLIPDSRSSCPLATAITPEDVEAIRGQYPGVPVLAHINTSLPVKATADATFTAANAQRVAEAMPGERVIMVPDQFLAQYVAAKTRKKIITWAGASDIYAGFTADEVSELRKSHPAAKILAHPQSRPAVTAAADFIGSTAQMAAWLEAQQPSQAIILSDAAVSDNLAAVSPETEFFTNGASSIQNRRINLENILWSLHTMTEEVTVASVVGAPARAAVARMLELSK